MIEFSLNSVLFHLVAQSQKKKYRKRCEICSKLTKKKKKKQERRQLRRSGVFIVNLEHISHFI